LELPTEKRLEMIDVLDSTLSIRQQCKMVNISHSSYYAYKKEKPATDQELKKMISNIYASRPEYGSRRIAEIVRRSGIPVNRKRIQRLMREMEIQGIHPKKNLSMANSEHKKYPYIARDKPIVKINQVWSTDITYVKTKFGKVYLVAIIDWHSRLVLAWGMSNTMNEELCIEALNKALKKGTPEIFNTDQGSQFTGKAFISTLLHHGIKPSMDGKGRATDNAQIERFWRSVKWEEVYLHEPQTFIELQKKINDYIKHYNHERPHQSLNYKTPSEAHFDLKKKNIDSNGKFIYAKKELKYVE
jgi:putative transposase